MSCECSPEKARRRRPTAHPVQILQPFPYSRSRGELHDFRAIAASMTTMCRIPGGVRTNMQETHYGLRVTISVPYELAVERATEALKAEGFGVLTTIDVQDTLRSKLNREFRQYVILGACNPLLADRALHAELEIGLLLPCNVVVYETGANQSVVAAMAPLTALGIVGDNPELSAVAREADERLRRVLAALEAA